MFPSAVTRFDRQTVSDKVTPDLDLFTNGLHEQAAVLLSSREGANLFKTITASSADSGLHQLELFDPFTKTA